MKRSKIPSLDDLRAFETVARLGSMRAAADELALTHGAVSRRVSKLARDIETQLLVPDGRGIKLTPDGERLSSATAQAFEILAQTLVEIRARPAQQPVLLSCERSVAMRWLIPRLSEFQDEYPNIPVHLSVGGGSFNFEREGITLAIRRMDFPVDPHWLVETLFEESVGPVMPPSMCERFQVGDYVALGSRTRPNAWKNWLAEQSSQLPPRELRLMDHHFLMAEAAANGLGVAMCPKVLAMDDIGRGRVTAPHGFALDGSVYGVIYPMTPNLRSEGETVRKWLRRISSNLSGAGPNHA